MKNIDKIRCSHAHEYSICVCMYDVLVYVNTQLKHVESHGTLKMKLEYTVLMPVNGRVRGKAELKGI